MQNSMQNRTPLTVWLPLFFLKQDDLYRMLLRYVYTALNVASKNVSRDLPNGLQKRKKGSQIPCDGICLPLFLHQGGPGENRTPVQTSKGHVFYMLSPALIVCKKAEAEQSRFLHILNKFRIRRKAAVCYFRFAAPLYQYASERE